MVRLVLALTVAFLIVLSMVPAFADSGTMSVVSGKTYQVAYNTSGVKIQSMETNSAELIVTVQVSSPSASLALTMPRTLIDSKQGSTDIPFIVLVDGAFVSGKETNPTSTTRTISIPLSPGNSQVEVIGTFVATSSGGSTSSVPPVSNPTPQTPTTPKSPTSPPQTQNTEPETPPTPTPPVTQPSTSPENTLTQANATQNISFKIPYVPNVTVNLSPMDLAVIGAISLVIIIVIASAARRRPARVARKN